MKSESDGRGGCASTRVCSVWATTARRATGLVGGAGGSITFFLIGWCWHVFKPVQRRPLLDHWIPLHCRNIGGRKNTPVRVFSPHPRNTSPSLSPPLSPSTSTSTSVSPSPSSSPPPSPQPLLPSPSVSPLPSSSPPPSPRPLRAPLLSSRNARGGRSEQGHCPRMLPRSRTCRPRR